MSLSPHEILESGAKILEPFLGLNGFSFLLTQEGEGSGGAFANGQFSKIDRVLELHFRYSLGLVRYHAANHNVSHEFYMKELGVIDKCHYPGFSNNPLDGFRDLLHDLELFADDFLSGNGAVLIRATQSEAHDNSIKHIEDLAGYVGDTRARTEAKELFRQKRYYEVICLFQNLSYPELPSESELKMLNLAKKRINS